MEDLILKAGSITNLTDARYFAAFGVHFAGFCFDDSSVDYIEPRAAAEIRGWLSGPVFVAEFRNRPEDEMRAIIEISGVDLIQVPKEDLQSVASFSELNCIVEVNGEESDHELSGMSEQVKYLLLKPENKNPEQIKKYINRAQILHPVLLDIELDIATLDEIINSWKPAGLNLRGGSEEKTGLKAYDELDAIMEKLVYGD